ncbi:hypothetical protein C1H46_045922 [Malus baccata]|uniref:Uncharacterized protein n=1 Tax=Malus baccata TaxID=106549 RepID=A0A540K2N3_MALBA|nr:hypothetical protein C1H46_045922 [Malus baccata]
MDGEISQNQGTRRKEGHTMSKLDANEKFNNAYSYRKPTKCPYFLHWFTANTVVEQKE